MDALKNGNKWQLLRDFLLGGTFIFCITILWQTSSFVQKINDFMESQKEEWVHTDVRVKILETDMQIVKECIVAKTGKPFGKLEN
jgi:hypothetical protein